MKKVIIDILKKYKFRILLQIIFIGLNIYLLTYPPKIIGKIVDMLYDLEANKQNILNNTYYLIGICVILLIIRVIWKYFETNISRGFERDLKVDIFKRFLKLKLKDIQNIKNGEIMSYFVKDVNEIASERGTSFSAGQKQLLAFARIFAHNPSIFILDEATANIDTKTEELIQHSIDKISKEKTSIFIAHRLSTIVNVDKIIVLSNGEIIEQGSHNALMKISDGYYHKLYNAYYTNLAG